MAQIEIENPYDAAAVDYDNVQTWIIERNKKLDCWRAAGVFFSIKFILLVEWNGDSYPQVVLNTQI